MTYRITNKQLEARINWLNELTGSPAAPYTRDEDGKMIANVGNYHLSQQSGGSALNQMANESGGINDVFRSGHITKRELFDRIDAMMIGFRVGKDWEQPWNV